MKVLSYPLRLSDFIKNSKSANDPYIKKIIAKLFTLMDTHFSHIPEGLTIFFPEKKASL